MEVASNGPSDYEKKERKITALPEAQRLCMSLDEKDYSDHVYELAEELVKAIALEDADEIGKEVDEKVDEKDIKEMSDDELEDAHYKELAKKEKK